MTFEEANNKELELAGEIATLDNSIQYKLFEIDKINNTLMSKGVGDKQFDYLMNLLKEKTALYQKYLAELKARQKELETFKTRVNDALAKKYKGKL